MSVEISFPVEFVVEGVPVSQQAKRPKTREAWKQRVRTAAKAELSEGHWATEVPVHVTIFYFAVAEMAGDLDNIVKPILDGLSGLVYLDDGQVERILVQKFERGRFTTFRQPSARLAEAADMSRPRVYIEVDAPISEESPNE